MKTENLEMKLGKEHGHMTFFNASTGISYKSPRSDLISRDHLIFLSDWIGKSFNQGFVDMPFFDKCKIWLSVDEVGVLFMTVFNMNEESMFSFGVARNQDEKEKLWTDLSRHESFGDLIKNDPIPEVPFCVAFIHKVDAEAWEMSEDFGRAVAWTWLRIQEDMNKNLDANYRNLR